MWVEAVSQDGWRRRAFWGPPLSTGAGRSEDLRVCVGGGWRSCRCTVLTWEGDRAASRSPPAEASGHSFGSVVSADFL